MLHQVRLFRSRTFHIDDRRLGRQSRRCHLALDYSLLSSEMRPSLEREGARSGFMHWMRGGRPIAPWRCPSQRSELLSEMPEGTSTSLTTE